MANLEKLPSGSWRYKKMINGQLVRGTFDHKPNDLEISMLIAEKSKTITVGENKPFVACAKEYIKVKENILSPTTLKSYESIVRNMSDSFKKMKINDISTVMVQKEVNDYSATHSPKSTKNYHGFISSVLSVFRHDMVLHTTLPQNIESRGILPTESDIKSLLAAVKDTEYSIPFQLGVLGLRRSEVCALTLDDLNGNILTINKVKIKDRNNKWIIKPYTKTEGSTREIYIPDSLVEEIKEQGYVYSGSPDTLGHYLHRLQKKINIPQFKLHSLRHYFASYAHAKGIPDAYIMKMGGWSSDGIMKKVYREAMKDENFDMQKKIGSIIF